MGIGDDANMKLIILILKRVDTNDTLFIECNIIRENSIMHRIMKIYDSTITIYY